MKKKLHYLPFGSCYFQDQFEKAYSFILQEQLLNEGLWARFVEPFVVHEDSTNLGWRGEYFGKMMRGACLCYAYNPSEELYKVLSQAVTCLLNAQDELGRISTYNVENEFQGWDVWCRKYVVTGLLHFFWICQDPILKEKVLTAVKRHADYILDHVGGGKKEITDTSRWWLGVNSSSILEPFVNLYNVTEEKKYLDFASYIVSTGGIKDGNLLDCVGKMLPYQYPETKAYETMSFFEGVYQYAKVTGDEALKNKALRFFFDVYESETSIIGNAGAKGEEFNHGSLMQATKPENFCQETCVSVTWMRILDILYRDSPDPKYMDMMERISLNAYLGPINYHHQHAHDFYHHTELHPLPFDSYSPLVDDCRGKSTGGLQFFEDGEFYGCCAAIGSAGIGIMGLDAIMEDDDAYYLNAYYPGKIQTNGLAIEIDGDTNVSLRIDSSKPINLRIPSWAHDPTIDIDGDIHPVEAGTYHLIEAGRHSLSLLLNAQIDQHLCQDRVAYTYGPYVLCVAEENNPQTPLEEIHAETLSSFLMEAPQGEERLRFRNNGLVFTDFASSGKKWDECHNRLSVWLKK